MSASFCVLLYCGGKGLVMSQSPVTGDLPKYLNGFTISEGLMGERRNNS
jgi:hypothetical protein